MGKVDTSNWTHIGTTANAEFYAAEPALIVVVPHDDSVDDEHTARASIRLQDEHWRRVGHRGATVVYMDPVLSQEGGARAVYATETAHTLTTCYALVGESFFAHASAMVFEGLAKPGVPTRVFRSLDEARPWFAEMNRVHGGPVA